MPPPRKAPPARRGSADSDASSGGGCCASLCRALGGDGLSRRRRAAELASLHAGEISVVTDAGAERFAELFPVPDEMHTNRLSGEERQRMLQLFAVFDGDGNNRVSEREIRVGLTRLGNPPTVAEAKKIVAQLDLGRGGSKDGFLDWEEFTLGVLHRRSLLFEALYGGKVLTGEPTLPTAKADRDERKNLSRLKQDSAHDPRARLSAVIAAQTGRRASPLV